MKYSLSLKGVDPLELPSGPKAAIIEFDTSFFVKKCAIGYNFCTYNFVLIFLKYRCKTFMKYTLYLCDNMMFNKGQDQLTNAKILFDYSKVAFSTSCCSIDVTVQSAQAQFTFEKCCQTQRRQIASHCTVTMMVCADWFNGYF